MAGLHELGAKFETGVQTRRRVLLDLRWGSADHCIEEADVIEKFLTHLDKRDASAAPSRLPPCRAPPQASLFD
jgi:hypothetical protein